MSDEANKPEAGKDEPEAIIVEPERAADAQEAAPEIRDPSGRSSFLPTALSGIAVLLAVAALVLTLQGQHKGKPVDSMQNIRMQAIDTKLDRIDARIASMESQLAGDKVDAAHRQIGRILFELKQVSPQVDATTRKKIDQAYRILRALIPAAVEGRIEMGPIAVGTPAKKSAEGKGASEPATKSSAVPEPSSDRTQNPAPASDSQAPAANSNTGQPKPSTAAPSNATNGTTQDASPSKQGGRETAPNPDAGTTTL